MRFLKLYRVFDVTAHSPHSIFEAPNDETAAREYQRQARVNSNMAHVIEDMSLQCLGYYEPESGIIMQEPVADPESRVQQKIVERIERDIADGITYPYVMDLRLIQAQIKKKVEGGIYE